MKIFIVSDDVMVGEKVRLVLAGEGCDCPSSNVLPLNAAVHVLGKERPDLIAVIMHPNPERALGVILTMKAQGPIQILAIGGAEDAKLVLRALRSGADDYIDSSALDGELTEALRRWRSRVTSTLAAGKVISLISPSGGCGVSTLAASLAVSLVQPQERVLLVDLHLFTDDLASLLDLKPTYSIADLCQNISTMDRSLFERALTSHENGVDLLAPPRQAEDTKGVTPIGVCQLLGLARSAFPFILVDVAVDSGDTMLEVLIQSDLILVGVKPDVVSLRNAKRLLDRLEWLGIAPALIKIVLVRVGQPGEVAPAKVEAALRSKVFHVIPEDLKTVNSCNNMGVPVTKALPRSKFASAVNSMVSEIRKVLVTTPKICSEVARLRGRCGTSGSGEWNPKQTAGSRGVGAEIATAH